MDQALKFGIQCITNREIEKGDAVMFDIDDTLIRSIDGTPINEMIQLFHICQSRGYIMVIITARPHTLKNVTHTHQQLLIHGITQDRLIFAEAWYKTKAKENTGLHYVLSVGDLYTDLDGSDHYIKLPDWNDKNVYTK
jgi:predicted HAD superfamily phosphohydrolase YqeG